MLRFLVILLIISTSHSAIAEPTAEKLLAKMAEAKDYLRVKPSVSSQILKQYLGNIGKLTKDEQLRWHQSLLRSSIALNDLKQVESSVRVMLSYPELEQQTDKFVSMLSTLGIFLRRSGHPQESLLLFNCGLRQPIKETKQRISLLISKGNSLSYLNKNDQARSSYAKALQLANKTNAEVFKSAIYNTLGILAIKEENYVLAKDNLINALQLSQNISRRSGQIVAGLQLMMLSVLTNNPELYDRLHYRISRLTLASNNDSRHAYLFWIEKAHKVSKGKVLTIEEQEELLKKLEQIKPVNIGLYNQLVEKFAKPFGLVSKPVVKEYSPYKGDLLNHIQQCKRAE